MTDASNKVSRRLVHLWSTQRVNRTAHIRMELKPSENAAPFGITGESKFPVDVTVFSHRGEFYCEVDLEELLRPVIERAAVNKTAKAQGCSGAIRVKRLTDQVIAQGNKQNPIPEGYEVVKT